MGFTVHARQWKGEVCIYDILRVLNNHSIIMVYNINFKCKNSGLSKSLHTNPYVWLHQTFSIMDWDWS